jgi:hypothetical protein
VTAVGNPQLHLQATAVVDGIGIEPFDVELSGGSENLGLGAVKNRFQATLANRIQHGTMLVAQNLFFLGVAESRRRGHGGIGGCLLANAAAAHKNLGLEQKVGLACLALHVVNGFPALDIGIKAEDHWLMISFYRTG